MRSSTLHSIHHISKTNIHKSEIDKLLKTSRTKVLHTCSLSVPANDFAKKYKHSPRFKDIYPYSARNQLPSSVPTKKRIKSDRQNYVINKLLF